MATKEPDQVDADDGEGQLQRSRKRLDLLSKSKLLKLALLTLPAVLVSLLLGEVLFRALGISPGIRAIRANSPQSAYKLSENPILVYELKANYHDDNPDFFDRLPRTNSHGQRDVEREWGKPEGVQRILVLGDSVTVGDGIRDLNDTIPRQLEQALDDGQREVLNLGVTGYCTASEVELLRTKGLKYDPDLVIVVFVENDYQHAAIGVMADELGQGELATQPAAKRPAVVEQFFVHSHLFRFASLMTNLYGFRDQFQPPPLTEIRQLAGFDNNVQEGLLKLRRLSDEHGFQTMIVIWPAFMHDGIVNRPLIQETPDKIVVELIAEQLDIPTFRLSTYFESDYRRAFERTQGQYLTPRDLYTIDGMHPNPTGAKIAAQGIATILASRANDSRDN